MNKTELVEVTLKLPKQIAEFIKETYHTDNLEKTLTKEIVEVSCSQVDAEDDDVAEALVKKYDLLPIFKQYGILPNHYQEDPTE